MPEGVAKSSGIVAPKPLKWRHRLAAALVYGYIRLVSATTRYEFINSSGLFQPHTPQGAIFCIWHNRLALSLISYRKYLRRGQNSRRLAALVSASKDGGIVARILERFGVQPVRGSTSRRGPQALRELTTWAERGFDVAITPDGPRGPCYEVQPGVMSLAQLTGLPVVPVSYNLSWKIRLKSWDRFQIPLPFSRCQFIIGEPVQVPREATDDERASLRLAFEQRLRAITRD